MIRVKRAYEPAVKDDGRRVLVERLWPRGVPKARLRLDEWAKDVAPSAALRRWFGHDPKRWLEFRSRYYNAFDLFFAQVPDNLRTLAMTEAMATALAIVSSAASKIIRPSYLPWQ